MPAHILADPLGPRRRGEEDGHQHDQVRPSDQDSRSTGDGSSSTGPEGDRQENRCVQEGGSRRRIRWLSRSRMIPSLVFLSFSFFLHAWTFISRFGLLNPLLRGNRSLRVSILGLISIFSAVVVTEAVGVFFLVLVPVPSSSLESSFRVLDPKGCNLQEFGCLGSGSGSGSDSIDHDRSLFDDDASQDYPFLPPRRRPSRSCRDE